MTFGGHEATVSSASHHHLSYVHVAVAIDPDIVGSKKVARSGRIATATPPRLEEAVAVKDAQPALRSVRRGNMPREESGAPSNFCHKDITAAINEHFHRTRHVSPLLNERSGRIENLNAAVFPIRNINPAFAINRDAVR
jgi:hypothetical protein